MSDLIDRQAAIDALNEYFDRIGKLKRRGLTKGEKAISLDTVGTIKTLPPAEPKRGKWIRTGSGSLYDNYECSECGKAPKWECMGDNRWKIAFTDFCPNCGADMRGEQDGN